jgi:hypothetical protein
LIAKTLSPDRHRAAGCRIKSGMTRKNAPASNNGLYQQPEHPVIRALL